MCSSLFAGTFGNASAAAWIRRMLGLRNFAGRVLDRREPEVVRDRERDVDVADRPGGAGDQPGDAGGALRALARRERRLVDVPIFDFQVPLTDER